MQTTEQPKGLTPEDFISAGYKKFKDSFKEYAEFGLQKKFTDEKGVKYFITLWAYNWEKYPQHIGHPWSFETDIHFDAPDGYIRLSWSVDDIQKMQERTEKFWVFVGSPYYKKWLD